MSHTHTSVHIHKLPQTHTHIHSQRNSGPLPSLHPQYIRYIFSNVPHARLCSWRPLAAHTHRHLHTEHGHTWSAPKCTRRPSHTKHTLMLITQTLSCQTPTRRVHQAPTSRHSLPTPSHPQRGHQDACRLWRSRELGGSHLAARDDTDHQQFFTVALLRYSSHTIQSTHFKCPIPWFLGYSQSCAVITMVKSRKFHHPQKKPFVEPAV